MVLRDGSSQGLAAVNDGFAVAGKFSEGRSSSKKKALKVVVQVTPSSLLSGAAIKGGLAAVNDSFAIARKILDRHLITAYLAWPQKTNTAAKEEYSAKFLFQITLRSLLGLGCNQGQSSAVSLPERLRGWT